MASGCFKRQGLNGHPGGGQINFAISRFVETRRNRLDDCLRILQQTRLPPYNSVVRSIRPGKRKFQISQAIGDSPAALVW
jgi:hypothetical protein